MAARWTLVAGGTGRVKITIETTTGLAVIAVQLLTRWGIIA